MKTWTAILLVALLSFTFGCDQPAIDVSKGAANNGKSDAPSAGRRAGIPPPPPMQPGGGTTTDKSGAKKDAPPSIKAPSE